jgi:hypothetical protein
MEDMNFVDAFSAVEYLPSRQRLLVGRAHPSAAVWLSDMDWSAGTVLEIRRLCGKDYLSWIRAKLLEVFDDYEAGRCHAMTCIAWSSATIMFITVGAESRGQLVERMCTGVVEELMSGGARTCPSMRIWYWNLVLGAFAGEGAAAGDSVAVSGAHKKGRWFENSIMLTMLNDFEMITLRIIAAGNLPGAASMTLLKNRLEATAKKVDEAKEARKAVQKASRQAHKQTRADRERKVMLVGEAVLRRLERGELDAVDFYRMMDEALSRPADRALFDLD